MSTCCLRMTKFRLKMDMSQFYDDERNLAYILVDPKWERVICLQQHVEKLFDVSSVNFVTNDGVYIPPKESIDIIKSSDVLRAIVPEMKKRKKKSRPCLYDGFGDQSMAGEILERVGEKRKHEADKMSLTSTPNCQPCKKIKSSSDKAYYSDVQILVDVHSPKTNQYSINGDEVSSPCNSSGEDNPKLEEIGTNEVTKKSRKRKRIRKKKAHISARLSSVPLPISSSTLRLSKAMSTPKNQSLKHLHFDNNPSQVEKKFDRVLYRCALNMDGELEPREIEAEEAEEGAPPPKKPKIHIHENILLVKGSDESGQQPEHNNTSVIEIDDSIEKTEPELEITVIEPFPESVTINTAKLLPLSEPLVGLPCVGDIVLFKVTRLSETCCPEVSDSICVRCEGVDPIKGTISCLVLDGYDQVYDMMPETTQSNGDGLVPIEREINSVQFVLDQLLDKRIFRMT